MFLFSVEFLSRRRSFLACRKAAGPSFPDRIWIAGEHSAVFSPACSSILLQFSVLGWAFTQLVLLLGIYAVISALLIPPPNPRSNRVRDENNHLKLLDIPIFTIPTWRYGVFLITIFYHSWDKSRAIIQREEFKTG